MKSHEIKHITQQTYYHHTKFFTTKKEQNLIKERAYHIKYY